MVNSSGTFFDSFLEGASLLGIGLITGANVYISGFEVPGRQTKKSAAYQLENWQSMVPKARDILKPFGMTVNVLIGGALYRTKKSLWLAPFMLLGALGPWTAWKLVPVNDELSSLHVGYLEHEKQVPDLVKKWGQLHLVRTILSVGAFVTGIAALIMDE